MKSLLSIFALVLGALLFMGVAAQAQTDFSECDGLSGPALGLCKAGVKLDCQGDEFDHAACANIEETLQTISGVSAPWNACPCFTATDLQAMSLNACNVVENILGPVPTASIFSFAEGGDRATVSVSYFSDGTLKQAACTAKTGDQAVLDSGFTEGMAGSCANLIIAECDAREFPY